MIAQEPSGARELSFRVLALGPLLVYGDQVQSDATRWARPARSLFLLLVTAGDWRRTRDEVIDTLWPDAAPDAGAANLRSALFHLRRLLGAHQPSPVLYEGGWISLNLVYSWDVDLVRFEALVQTTGEEIQALEEAIGLYRGEPLSDERYADWTGPIRERLRRLWRDGSLRLARQYRERGEQDLAVEQYEKILGADVFDEAALRELLLVLTDMGRRSEAVRRYDRFALLLREELDLSPDEDTQAAIAHVRAIKEPTTSRSTDEVPRADGELELPIGGFLGARPTWPIIGRDLEIERIRVFAESAVEGAGRFVLMTGEAGIGKTRLAQEAMLVLRRRGFVAVTGRCYRRLHDVPLSPVRDLITELSRTLPSIWTRVIGQWPNLVALLPDAETVLSSSPFFNPEQRHALVQAIALFLVAVAEQTPLVILLDDLQWADDATLDVLQHLVRETRGSRVLLLGTYCDTGLDRDHPLSVSTRELVREGLVDRAVIQRLPVEDTGHVIEMVLGDMDFAEEFVDFTHRRTKGNPLYIHRMLQSLGGRYRLIRQIGIGGMGRVFEAIDTRTGESVAAKLMFARAEADPKALQRFQQEGAVLATLEHPNIVRVRGTFLDEHASCIVMELLNGQSLKQTMREQKLGLQRIKHLGAQVAAALAFAHHHGVVHRDVKPDNIMLVGDDHVKVTDFGIARLLRSREAMTTMTSLGMTMGTPHYMAPEQVLGQRVDGRADIYSTGALLYELVTGRPPFEGEEPMAIAVQHVQAAPAPPSTHNSSLPVGWDALILKALMKQPADRFQTAEQLQQAISALTLPASASPGQSTVAHKPVGWVRRHARMAAGLGAAGAGCFILSALFISGVARGSSASPARNGALVPRSPFAIFGLVQPRAVQFSQLAGLAVDPKGNIFATDVGNSRLDRLSPTGKLTGQWPLGSRGATVEGGDTYEIVGPSGTIVDEQGDVYVADYSYHRIQKLTVGAGSLKGWGAPGSAPGPSFGATGLASDSAGNVYSADAFNNRIYKLSRTGKLLRQWGSRGSGPGQLESPGGIAVDSHGNVYVVDTGNDRIQKFSGVGVPLARWGATGSRPGQFVSPSGVAIDQHGNVYVADTGNNRIQKLSAAGQPLTQWTTRGCNARQIPQPVDVKLDAQANLYVADGTSQCIQKLSPSGRLLRQWGQQTAARGQLKEPHALTIDGPGNLYVADSGNDRIQKFSRRGKPLVTWGERGARNGQFQTPNGIARDTGGNMYVADTGNNRIQILAAPISARSAWSTRLPRAGQAFAPEDLTFDHRGNLYTSDWINGRVMETSPQGKRLAAWGSNGNGQGRLLHPSGLTIDEHGNVYIADTGNHRIQRISATGSRSLQPWRSGGGRTRLSAPVGVVADGRGHLFVSDEAISRVSEFSLTGLLISQWGGAGAKPGQFSSPQGLAIDSSGNVYVADAGNNRIQAFSAQD